jgi:CheY-like chemotaxis protein
MIPKSEARNAEAPGGDLSVDGRNRQGPGRRVLFVEHAGAHAGTIDARDRATSRLLARAGYEVRVVGNVCEALGAFYTDTLPDVVVLDLETSVSSGWQFLLVLREDPKLGHIPVVSISADGGAHTVASSGKLQDRASGPVAPVGAGALLREVERAVQARHRLAEDLPDIEDRLASIGRVTDLLAHEINDPLAMIMMNLGHSLDALRPPLRTMASLAPILAMLEDCQVGAARIQDVAKMLAHLSDHARAEAGGAAQAP